MTLSNIGLGKASLDLVAYTVGLLIVVTTELAPLKESTGLKSKQNTSMLGGNSLDDPIQEKMVLSSH